MSNIIFEQEILDTASNLLRAVAHKLRLSIIQLLDSKGEINVNEIYTTLRLEQSITSQHLKILRDAEVVFTRRDGKMIYYSLNYQKLADVEYTVSAIDDLVRKKPKA